MEIKSVTKNAKKTTHFWPFWHRNGSRGVLIMSVSSTVPEKSHGNKKCDKEGEENDTFLAFLASL